MSCLTDAGQHLVTGIPTGIVAGVQSRLGLRIGPVADALVQLDAGMLTKT